MSDLKTALHAAWPQPIRPPVAIKPQPKTLAAKPQPQTQPALKPAGNAPAAPPPADPPRKRTEPDAKFFAQAKASEQVVELLLGNGRIFTGKILAFGLYSVCLATESGAVIVFKHAIATASLAGEASRE